MVPPTIGRLLSGNAIALPTERADVSPKGNEEKRFRPEKSVPTPQA